MPTSFHRYQPLYSRNIIDFGAPQVQPLFPGSAYSNYILTNRNIIDFNSPRGHSGYSTGNITFTFNSNSVTSGYVNPFSDGVIFVPRIAVNSQMPIVEACRKILNSVGLVSGSYPAKVYPISIVKNGITLFTIKSLLMGSKVTIDPQYPDYQILYRFNHDSSTALV